MYNNQMNAVNHMNPINLLNSNTANTKSFLTLNHLNNPNTHAHTTNTHMNINRMDESPDSLRSTSHSATNSTTTPTDHSSFMPPIGAINNSSPPITSPAMINTTGHNPNPFSSSNARFRFDAPSNVSNIQSIHPQPMMKHVNTTATPVFLHPQFVGKSPTTSPYQVQNHRGSPYHINNRFNTQHNNNIFNNNIFNDNTNTQHSFHDNNDNNNNNNNMPLLQNDQNISDTFNVSNNLNVTPAFTNNIMDDNTRTNPNPNTNTNNNNNNNNNNLHLMPPNIMSINPLNSISMNNNNMMNTLIHGVKQNSNIHHGPKTEYTAPNIPKLQSKLQLQTSQPRGAAKFGFTSRENNAIITDINNISKLSIPKPSKLYNKYNKYNKYNTNNKIKKIKKKKNSNDNIEFIETVEWSKAHRYHQYCPFCVRDERKKHKFEFWDKLPLRETLNKQERKEYDRECKQLLQNIEDKVKKKIVFDSGIEYRRHYDTYHKKYGFKCIYSGCDKESSSWYNFVAHLTQHDRENGRPFYCNYIGCNRRSSTKHNLIKHLQGVHKWKIINKEEPKLSNTKINNNINNITNINHINNINNNQIYIKSESITTASPSPNYCGMNININNNKNAFNRNDDRNKRSDVIQEPIIVQNNNTDYYYNNIINNTQSIMPYTTNSNFLNQTINNGSNYSISTINMEQKQQRVSNNKNCIVSPHLLTAINDHPFIDDQENDDDSLSVSYFPLNHEINTPNNTKDYDNIDIFNSIYDHIHSPAPMIHNTI